jgi:very-short-patch-repair endonuclease
VTHRSLGLGEGAEVVARVPVVEPELLWVRAARFLELEDLVVLGDRLTRREGAASSRARLGRALARAGQRRGVVRARQALEWVAERTDSAMESLVRLRLVWPRRWGGYGLGVRPAVNARIELAKAERAALGRRFLLADLLWAEARVAVEYDGEAAHFAGDSARWAYDVRRETVLREKGYRVFRVSKGNFFEPRNFDAVARQIFRALGCRFRGGGWGR